MEARKACFSGLDRSAVRSVWRHTRGMLKLCRLFGKEFKVPPGGEGVASKSTGAVSAIEVGFYRLLPLSTGLPQGDRAPVLAVGRV